MKKLLFTIVFAFISTQLWGTDILKLNNARTFKGKVTKIKNCVITFKTSTGKFQIPATDIFALEFGDPEDKVYQDYIGLGVDDPDKCLNGRFDAEMHHGKQGGHFLLGLLFGPFAMVGTALSNPRPETGKHTYLLSENSKQFDDPAYLTCYKKKAKGRLLGMEALGWATWVFLSLGFSE